MYYSAIGTLALLVLVIENGDILYGRGSGFDFSRNAWRIYRSFLFTVVLYYLSDILWGILQSRKLATALTIDTSLYFVTMAAGIYFWTQYVVAYLEEDNRFGRFLTWMGRIISVSYIVLTLINIFTPIIFSVDADCTYHALPARYVFLVAQILLLVGISTYAFLVLIRHRHGEGKAARYRAVIYFGLIMATMLYLQVWYPLLPLYAIAYLLATCLLRVFVIRDEKERYRAELLDAEKVKELQGSITALLNNMPALSFYKDAQTGVYMACNQAFAEYAHKDSPEGVAGLTDAQIFDAETAEHFVADDQMALSMEEPFIFFEDVPDAAGNQRQFQTTKIKFIDGAGRLCILGMCQDVTDIVRIRRENAQTKEAYEQEKSAAQIYMHIAQTLSHGYSMLFYVNLETEEYIEYAAEAGGRLTEKRRGTDFFDSCKREAQLYLYEDDREAFVKTMNRDTLRSVLKKNGTHIMTYRMLTERGPMYVSARVSMREDDDRYVIIGVTDVDEELRQRQARERSKEERATYARLSALAGNFLCVYIVDPETGHFRELSVKGGIRSFGVPSEGEDFFATTREIVKGRIHEEDFTRFFSVITKEHILEEVEKGGIFALNYRLLMDGEARYVQFRAAMVEEEGEKRLIVGLSDVDALVRQEEEYAKALANARSRANIDALTGVRNKYAYLDEEEKLDRQIKERAVTEFAIVILDLNDLKKINDTEGHKAGDEFIRGACKLICDIFKRSPVFRVGGDEFAVIVRGEDFDCLDELIGRIAEHNAQAVKTGGIVIACGSALHERDEAVARVFERADQRMYENKAALKEGRA